MFTIVFITCQYLDLDFGHFCVDLLKKLYCQEDRKKAKKLDSVAQNVGCVLLMYLILLTFAITMTFISGFRSSKKAPGSAIHHQYGNKTNRPTVVRGQCWVSLSLTILKCVSSLGIPILSQLARQGGNSRKVGSRLLPEFENHPTCQLRSNRLA
jgi:hypothetical protein